MYINIVTSKELLGVVKDDHESIHCTVNKFIEVLIIKYTGYMLIAPFALHRTFTSHSITTTFTSSSLWAVFDFFVASKAILV